MISKRSKTYIRNKIQSPYPCDRVQLHQLTSSSISPGSPSPYLWYPLPPRPYPWSGSCCPGDPLRPPALRPLLRRSGTGIQAATTTGSVFSAVAITTASTGIGVCGSTAAAVPVTSVVATLSILPQERSDDVPAVEGVGG